jgi:hypothetical protein
MLNITSIGFVWTGVHQNHQNPAGPTMIFLIQWPHFEGSAPIFRHPNAMVCCQASPKSTWGMLRCHGFMNFHEISADKMAV